jgi:hypothetical protein
MLMNPQLLLMSIDVHLGFKKLEQIRLSAPTPDQRPKDF